MSRPEQQPWAAMILSVPTRVDTARIAVGAAGVAAAAVFIASVPAAFRRTAAVCAATADCPPGRVTPEGAEGLSALGLTPAGYSFYVTFLVTVLAAVFLAAAALLLRVPGGSAAVAPTAAVLILLGISFPQTLGALGDLAPGWSLAGDVVERLGVVALTWWVVSFPDPRSRPAWTTWLVLAVAAEQGASLAGWQGPGPVADAALTCLWLLSLVYCVVSRYRTTGPAERAGFRFVAYGVTVALSGLLTATVAQAVLGAVPGTVGDLLVQAAVVLCFMAIPLSITAAVLRRGLWGVEASLARALTYGVLTVAVTAGYTAAMAGVAAALATGPTASAAAAGGLLALAVHPGHVAVRRGVDRVLYGDPQGAERALGDVEVQPGAPADAVLASFAQLVTQTLRLPYAQLTVAEGGLPGSRGSSGLLEDDWPVDDFTLVERGRQVGTLRVARRDATGALDPRDRRALDAVARQAASLAGTVLLSEHLRSARTQLVTAREEERRRLRNDLHDGLGPALGAVTLKLAAAANRLTESPDAARALLDEARQQTGDVVTDVRRLVQGLRPPALDELGLVGAVTAFASRTATDAVAIRVHASGNVRDLPAAVEVAAYRIVLEAVNNVLKHASARTCDIEIARRPGAVLLTVTDDGVGLPQRDEVSPAGVGLTSMTDRATELGGSLDVETAANGGTRVRAVLPFPLADVDA
ncbi:MAG TPA: sensor histidine kinase [Actinomycetales bacterium]|nr:sensor histidine kinase [Actinomycetales bacterium]